MCFFVRYRCNTDSGTSDRITVRQVHSEKDCGPVTNSGGSGEVSVRLPSIVSDREEPERRRQGDFLVRIEV